MKPSKKAQVTTFVIIGLLLASATIVVVTYREEIMKQFERRAAGEIPISEQLDKVETYTEDCIKETLLNGASTIGLQGGFYEIPQDDFPTATYNMMSNSLDLFGNGVLKIPYWSYLTPNNIQRTQIPSKQEIENTLAEYIDENLESCLNDYIPFRLEGYEVAYSEPSTTASLSDKKIISQTNMKIDTEYKEKSATFKSFEAKVDSNLGKLYSRALELFRYEDEKGFIENITLDFMAMYDEIPYSGIDFDCSPRIWMRTKVAQDLKAILALNIPTLKIEGTNYDSKDKTDKLLTFDAIKGSEKDMTVNFQFSTDWPIMMDVVGEEGEALRGKPFTMDNEASRFLMPLFCLNDYHFVYDIKYPILITLSKDDEIFQFAIMAVINNNQPKTNTADIPPVIEEFSPVCDNNIVQSTVIASGISTDGSTVPLEGVDVSIQCISSKCEIGKTRLEQTTYSLTEMFPPCLNGQIIAEKEGYHRAKEVVNTNIPSIFGLSMEPYYEIPVTVLINDEGSIRSPYDTEQVLFQFENIEDEFFTTYFHPSEEKLRLIAGEYKVSSTLLVTTQTGFKFKDEIIETCVKAPMKSVAGIFGLTEKKCISQDISGTTIDTLVSGGGSFYWDVDRRALATSNKIVLYSNRGPTPQTMQELNNQYQNMQQFSEEIIKPTFE